MCRWYRFGLVITRVVVFSLYWLLSKAWSQLLAEGRIILKIKRIDKEDTRRERKRGRNERRQRTAVRGSTELFFQNNKTVSLTPTDTASSLSEVN